MSAGVTEMLEVKWGGRVSRDDPDLSARTETLDRLTRL